MKKIIVLMLIAASLFSAFAAENDPSIKLKINVPTISGIAFTSKPQVPASGFTDVISNGTEYTFNDSKTLAGSPTIYAAALTNTKANFNFYLDFTPLKNESAGTAIGLTVSVYGSGPVVKAEETEIYTVRLDLSETTGKSATGLRAINKQLVFEVDAADFANAIAGDYVATLTLTVDAEE